MNAETILRSIARAQKKYSKQLFIIIIIITIFLGIGVTKIAMETDMNKEMPQQLPIYQLNDRIAATFGGQDTIIIILALEETSNNQQEIRDIRDPAITNYLGRLTTSLEQESMVESVVSSDSYLSYLPSLTLESTKLFLDQNDELKQFYSNDYKSTIMYATLDLGEGEEQLLKTTSLIKERIQEENPPAGVKIMVTGEAPLRIDIMDILGKDAVNTLLIASVIILLLLFIIERSFTKGLLVFAPLIFGLIFTIGSLGWLGIKLSIATVGVGAMILGLGVEYGSFISTRYYEERAKGNNQQDSLEAAVPAVGISILGSGTTTIIGFLSLTLSITPMLQHLGFALALGIFYSLLSTILIAPVIIILEENLEHHRTARLHAKYSKKRAKHQRNKR